MDELIKPFQSIDDQIKLLKERNLKIFDQEIARAREFLLNNNYYRISGYTLTLRTNDRFYDSVRLDNIIQIYEFDKYMRHSILAITETIEIRIKSMVAYYHAEKYGPLGYLDIDKFNCNTPTKIQDYLYIIAKADAQKKSMTDTEAFLKHHKEHRGDKLPFWVYVEVLTISDISKIYSLLEEDIQMKIASQLGYTHRTANEVIRNLLHSVSILRNICAHGGRLYNRLFIRKPRLAKKEKLLLRLDENGEPIYDRLFSYILVLKALSMQENFKELKSNIQEMTQEYSFVEMRYYGFPENWKEVL